jgi:hypothetical protein
VLPDINQASLGLLDLRTVHTFSYLLSQPPPTQQITLDSVGSALSDCHSLHHHLALCFSFRGSVSFLPKWKALYSPTYLAILVSFLLRLATSPLPENSIIFHHSGRYLTQQFEEGSSSSLATACSLYPLPLYLPLPPSELPKWLCLQHSTGDGFYSHWIDC